VARRGQAMGLDVVATNPLLDAEAMAGLGVRRVELDQMLAESDFISPHLPLSTEKHHPIGESALRAMKRSAFLLNTARGGLVDEPVLFRALADGSRAVKHTECYASTANRAQPGRHLSLDD
jgi:phosphoglycerate dehydrogenase-like enzyme